MTRHTLFAFALLLTCVALQVSAQAPEGNPSLLMTRLQFKAETITSYKGEYNDIWSWLPRVDFRTLRPLPSGAHFYVEVSQPGGAPWVTLSCNSDLEREGYECGHENQEEKKSTLAVGVVPFVIKMKNELTGTDVTLFTGRAKIEKSPSNEHGPKAAREFVYYVNQDWNLPIGTVSIDKDHLLNVRFWVRGEGIKLDPHVFYQGKEVGRLFYDGMLVSGPSCSPEIDYFPSMTVAETVPQGAKWQRMRCVIGGVSGEPLKRGPLPEPHALSANNGDYEVKVLRKDKLSRSIKFTVENGKIKDNGVATANKLLTGTAVVVPVSILDEQDGPWDHNAWKTDAFYGHPLTGFVWP
jgi:hypothetical protein